jgi:hypothetical protein
MNLLTLNLQTDALAEAQRLSAARGWSGKADQDALMRTTGPAPIVARARRAGTRRQLAGRMLLIFRISSLDASGRVAESQIAGALVRYPTAAGSHRRRRIREAVAAAERVARKQVEIVFVAHRDAAVAVSGRFTAARAARHRAIAGRADRGLTARFQAGLFDRRAERAQDAAADAMLDRERRLDDRVRSVEHGAILSHTVELVLVLTP